MSIVGDVGNQWNRNTRRAGHETILQGDDRWAVRENADDKTLLCRQATGIAHLNDNRVGSQLALSSQPRDRSSLRIDGHSRRALQQRVHQDVAVGIRRRGFIGIRLLRREAEVGCEPERCSAGVLLRVEDINRIGLSRNQPEVIEAGGLFDRQVNSAQIDNASVRHKNPNRIIAPEHDRLPRLINKVGVKFAREIEIVRRHAVGEPFAAEELVVDREERVGPERETA